MQQKLFALILPIALLGCGEQSPAGPDAGSPAPSSGERALFADVSGETIPDFVHFNGMSGELYFPEMMGAGVALLDYDNDGDVDLYFPQGHMLGPEKSLADARFPAPPGALTDRLYRNDTRRIDGSTQWRFTDVTDQAGIKAKGYGMGIAVADYDNDGDPDIYLTNFGNNQLWRNEGDGTFVDVTAMAGVDDPRWSVSATFFDFDADGLLDLYVGNYVDFDFDNHKPCKSTTSALDYCSPLVYEPQADSLFRNLGDGRFENLSVASGIAGKAASSLGAVAADFNGDRQIDLYVANDGMPNYLWLNQGDGRFVDGAELAGAAVNMGGSPEASMGVSAADFDGDGDLDLFMTHLNRETNTLYVNDGTGWFEDRTTSSGLGDASYAYTGFGTVWFDYDLDGLIDLFVANGAVTHIEEQVLAGDSYPLKQSNQLFRNRGAQGFDDISDQAGPGFGLAQVGRGAASGDLDNDGDIDLVISNNNGSAQVLSNRLQETRKAEEPGWIGVRLQAAGALLVNAEVALVDSGAQTLWQRIHTDGSYASASDPRKILPVSGAQAGVAVRWADGELERYGDLATGRYHTLVRGAGQSISGPAN